MTDKECFNNEYHMFTSFFDIVEDNLKKNKEHIEKIVNELYEEHKTHSSKNIRTNIYSMNVFLDYKSLQKTAKKMLKNY